jgi:hypothetical protein
VVTVGVVRAAGVEEGVAVGVAVEGRFERFDSAFSTIVIRSSRYMVLCSRWRVAIIDW